MRRQAAYLSSWLRLRVIHRRTEFTHATTTPQISVRLLGTIRNLQSPIHLLFSPAVSVIEQVHLTRIDCTTPFAGRITNKCKYCLRARHGQINDNAVTQIAESNLKTVILDSKQSRHITKIQQLYTVFIRRYISNMFSHSVGFTCTGK